MIVNGISVIQVNPYAVKQTKEVEDNSQLKEDRIRTINRMHRERKIYFPEYKEALGKVEGTFRLELLKQTPFPEEIPALGEESIREIWHNAKLRGRSYSRAKDIVEYAKVSDGISDG